MTLQHWVSTLETLFTKEVFSCSVKPKEAMKYVLENEKAGPSDDLPRCTSITGVTAMDSERLDSKPLDDSQLAFFRIGGFQDEAQGKTCRARVPFSATASVLRTAALLHVM